MLSTKNKYENSVERKEKAQEKRDKMLTHRLE